MKYIKGFSLIELMIVIAIIGILAMIAIPAYQDYITRARITEGIQLATAAKTAVVEYQQSMGDFPSDNAQAGLPDTITSQYVASIKVEKEGIIDIIYNQKSGVGTDNQIQFVPKAENGVISWNCNGAGTTVLKKYLPAICR